MAAWDWQQTTSLVIVSAAAWFLARRFYFSFVPRSDEAGGSPGCSGCAIARQCSTKVAAVSNCHSHLGALVELAPPSEPRRATPTRV